MLATLHLLLATAPMMNLAVNRPKMGVLPLFALLLFGLWVLLLRFALPGFGRKWTRAVLILGVLTVLMMVPRVLWRWAGAPPGIATLHRYLLGPMTVVQVAMLAGLFTAPLWVPLGRYIKRRLAREAAKAAPAESPAETPDPTTTHETAQAKELVTPSLPAPMVLTRRKALQTLPWILPGGAMVAASYGVFVESSRIVLRKIKLAIPGLPKELSGFRIGQVTDIHISRFQTQLHHLERGMELLARENLDLLCPTGDLCDEPRLHLDTLRIIRQVPARLGHIACAGNHELYLADPLTISRAYEKAQIQLLEEESVLVAGLRIAGIGFAHSGRVPRLDQRLVPAQLETALKDRRQGEPTLLLAHHPHAFEHVGGHQVALQLSGHTHGGQVGLGGRSLLEPVYPLIRGHYRGQDGVSQLFVSAGLGHWLPFRFGCPPEVVVIELVAV